MPVRVADENYKYTTEKMIFEFEIIRIKNLHMFQSKIIIKI